MDAYKLFICGNVQPAEHFHYIEQLIVFSEIKGESFKCLTYTHSHLHMGWLRRLGKNNNENIEKNDYYFFETGKWFQRN